MRYGRRGSERDASLLLACSCCSSAAQKTQERTDGWKTGGEGAHDSSPLSEHGQHAVGLPPGFAKGRGGMSREAWTMLLRSVCTTLFAVERCEALMCWLMYDSVLERLRKDHGSHEGAFGRAAGADARPADCLVGVRRAKKTAGVQ